ncbi:MAG: hypothetical protein A2428_12975 [Bdellovibrionales bacterium RIFOXYC1_FULL_54_43]|nr:MAG: hypothetical protein A2428_12975 [Bdellovibrionales bacterium RIFOXYC1_FULL_54_43]OFZ83982.1 MAG: hypothetical protein A2603_10555 [Bdellovibrionales bacterium RIFOXYD1_FULL_55_31]
MTETKAAYYQKTEVVETYDSARFQRNGGRVVAELESGFLSSLLLQTGVRPGRRALDCPCGTGRFIPLLLEKGFQVIAADISEPMLDKAREYGAGQYFCLDARKTGLPPATIDVWVMSRFLFHFEDIAPFFDEAARIIREQGYLIFDAYHWTPRSWVRRLQARWGGPVYIHGSKKIRAVAGRYGFELIRELPAFLLPPYVYAWMPYRLAGMIEWIAGRIPFVPKVKSYYLFRRNRA